MENIFDIIIVGAGPAGLSCAIEARKSGLTFLVLDQGSVANSIRQFEREMFFFSTPEMLEIGGVPFVVPTVRPTTVDCVNYYRSVVTHWKLDCEFYRQVTSVVKEDGVFMLHCANGHSYRSRTVVIATGYYDTPNPLKVPGEQLPHVTHFYRDPLPYFNQDVLIVGGKNSAVEAALDLWRHGARVTVVHRGDKLSTGIKYWILPDFENRVAKGSITLRLNSAVREFLPGTTIIENGSGGREKIKTDFCFILIGYRPDVPFLHSIGIRVDAESLVPQHDESTMETNVDGLFVAGGLVGGKFNNKIFIENGREHGNVIISAIREKLSRS